MMIYYVFFYGGDVVISLLVFIVYILLIIGAIKECRWVRGRISRMQLEGAVIMFLGTVAKWIVLNQFFGLDRLQSEEWTYWFNRGELGLYLVGLILFGLGFFLSRRPRLGLKPWDAGIKRMTMMSFLIALGFGILLWFYLYARWFNFSWEYVRVLFSIALYPFAIGYLKQERNPSVLPPEIKDLV
ncbi:MAG: hypothetical protein ACP5UA_13045 [Candidatus Hydrogenedens sp.]